MPAFHRKLFLPAIVLSLAGLSGCAATAPPQTSPTGNICMSFSAANQTGPGTLSARNGPDSTCRRAVVELWVNGVSDVFAASFDLVFDPSVVRLESLSTEDSFLAADGAEVKTLQRDEGGRVVIGITRWQTDTGQDAPNSRLLARLQFTRVARKSAVTSLDFVNASLLSSDMPPKAKSGVRWSGGTLELR